MARPSLRFIVLFNNFSMWNYKIQSKTNTTVRVYESMDLHFNLNRFKIVWFHGFPHSYCDLFMAFQSATRICSEITRSFSSAVILAISSDLVGLWGMIYCCFNISRLLLAFGLSMLGTWGVRVWIILFLSGIFSIFVGLRKDLGRTQFVQVLFHLIVKKTKIQNLLLRLECSIWLQYNDFLSL